MHVEMIQTVGTPAQCYRRGEVYDLDDAIARPFLNIGYARQTNLLPHAWRPVYDRLQIGAGKPCIFIPFQGEFGHAVLGHLPMVHHHAASRKVVCCRWNEEVLYPSADEFFTDWRDEVPDRLRCGTMRGAPMLWLDILERYPDHVAVPVGNLTAAEELVPIYPEQRIPFRPKLRGLRVDVVLGIRHREFCPEKNWQHWQQLADAIAGAGHTFAVVGQHETSLSLDGQTYHSGDFDDTDAAIELLQNCRLFVGSDTGGAHLAAAVGSPMLVFREYRGGNRDLRGRMELVNPGRVESMPDTAWDEPAAVIARTLARLEADALAPV